LLVTCISESILPWLHSHLQERLKEVSCHYGKRLSCLGQTFDFTVAGKVKATMERHAADMLRQYGVRGDATSPAFESLFDIDISSSPMSDPDRKTFHSRVMEIMYLAMRVRPDILVATSFLSTRDTKEDGDKLAQC
jgi:hypothetical protein